MAQQDEEVQKLAQEVEDQRRQKEAVRPAAEMPLVAKLVIVWVATYVLLFTDLLPWSQTAKFVALMVVMVAVFYITQSSSMVGEIPEEKVAALAYSRLVFYQSHRFGDGTRLPQGKIHLNPVGVPQFESWDSDKIKWWNHSFTIQSQVGSEVFRGIVRTHPISGMMRGIIKMDGEFTGTEEPNLKFVGREDLARSKWARDRLSQFPPGEGFL